jgi:hypothetical protein
MSSESSPSAPGSSLKDAASNTFSSVRHWFSEALALEESRALLIKSIIEELTKPYIDSVKYHTPNEELLEPNIFFSLLGESIRNKAEVEKFIGSLIETYMDLEKFNGLSISEKEGFIKKLAASLDNLIEGMPNEILIEDNEGEHERQGETPSSINVIGFCFDQKGYWQHRSPKAGLKFPLSFFTSFVTPAVFKYAVDSAKLSKASSPALQITDEGRRQFATGVVASAPLGINLHTAEQQVFMGRGIRVFKENQEGNKAYYLAGRPFFEEQYPFFYDNSAHRHVWYSSYHSQPTQEALKRKPFLTDGEKHLVVLMSLFIDPAKYIKKIVDAPALNLSVYDIWHDCWARSSTHEGLSRSFLDLLIDNNLMVENELDVIEQYLRILREHDEDEKLALINQIFNDQLKKKICEFFYYHFSAPVPEAFIAEAEKILFQRFLNHLQQCDIGIVREQHSLKFRKHQNSESTHYLEYFPSWLPDAIASHRDEDFITKIDRSFQHVLTCNFPAGNSLASPQKRQSLFGTYNKMMHIRQQELSDITQSIFTSLFKGEEISITKERMISTFISHYAYGYSQLSDKIKRRILAKLSDDSLSIARRLNQFSVDVLAGWQAIPGSQLYLRHKQQRAFLEPHAISSSSSDLEAAEAASNSPEPGEMLIVGDAKCIALFEGLDIFLRNNVTNADKIPLVSLFNQLIESDESLLNYEKLSEVIDRFKQKFPRSIGFVDTQMLREYLRKARLNEQPAPSKKRKHHRGSRFPWTLFPPLSANVSDESLATPETPSSSSTPSPSR